MQHCPNYLMHEDNYEKHAPRVSQVIAAVAKVSCKHELWLVARVNLNTIVVPAKQTQPIRMEFASALQTWCLWAASSLYAIYIFVRSFVHRIQQSMLLN